MTILFVSIHLQENQRKFRLGMYYLAAFITFMPYLRSLVSPYRESPMSNVVYIVIYRILTGIFYTFLCFHNADEFRDFFGTEQKDTISCNNNNGNNNFLASNGKIIDDSTNRLTKLVENKTLKYVSGKTEYKILHILTVIFKSTYCIHIPVLLWYYSQHKYPVLTPSEWVIIIN